MIPKAYTDQIPRSQIFSIVCVLGLVHVACSVLEPQLQPPVFGHIAAFVSMCCIFAGTIFFGYRSFIPGAILSFVVRIGQFGPNECFQMTVRDVAGAALLAAIWKAYRYFRPEPYHPFVSKEFDAVLSAIPDVLFVFDRDGKYREIFTGNPDLLIRPADQLLGKQIDDFLAPDSANSVIGTIRSVIDSGVPVSREDKIAICCQAKWFSGRIVPFDLRGERTALWASREVTQERLAIEQHRQDETLLRNLLRLQDRERKLIACELHDGMVQNVIAANLMAQVVARDIERDTKKAASNLKSLQAAIRDALEEARAMIQDLRPLSVDDDGIVGALDSLINEENERSGFDVTFNSVGEFDELSQLLEGSIYRIVQEALNNIRRHSQADMASISLVKNDETVELRIHDNGVGFDDATVRAESFGLKSIRNRAEMFGGHAKIDSMPGSGTDILVRLPCTAC